MSFRILRTLAAVLFLLVWQGAYAQTVYPQPQQSNITQERFTLDKPFKIKGLPEREAYTRQLLEALVPAGAKGKPVTLKVTQLKKGDAHLQRSGAYTLNISPKQIHIAAYDDRAVFYAAQTLTQLARKDAAGNQTLPIASITDYPDVAFRGTVEGFYGEPWSHEDRLEQLRFYGKLKLNTYIYGPKDDPYHSSPNWRKPYPADEAAHIRQLVEEAKRNKVDFVWAIHPGLDIQWTKADSSALLAKFGMMYDLGVRSFAVFFDDISGVGTDAKMQANMLNFLQHNFIVPKKDVASLIMCPTEYNKSWSNKKEGTYLDILGEHLDPAIKVMWTGNRVVDDITKEGLEWVNKRIQRPAFVWWNFPVSDYVRDHLLMGPSYGLETNAAGDMSGFVTNPMDKAEASKPAIFSVALYAWNMDKYDPQQAWEAATKYVMPEAVEAFQVFSTHNSDPGPNGHGYRRTESVAIKPYIETFLEAYEKGQAAPEAAARLKQEFASITQAPAQIKRNSPNKRLVAQLAPWLQQFELLGKAGTNALLMAENRAGNNTAAIWDAHLKVEALLDSMAVVDATLNQNPYQPGVKSGSLVLMPFVNKIYTSTGSYLLGNKSVIESINSQAATAAYSQSQKLGSQPLLYSNKGLAYSPMLEVAFLDSGEYIGFKPVAALRPTALYFNLGSNNILKWGVFETSTDGNAWTKAEATATGGKGQITITDPRIKLVRFRNASEKRQNFYLKEFRLEVQPAAGQNQSVYATDGSISTYQTLTAAELVKVVLPEKLRGGDLAILVNTNGGTFTVSATGKKGNLQTLYSGSENYVVLKASQLKNVSVLTFATTGSQPVRIYELVRQQPAS